MLVRQHNMRHTAPGNLSDVSVDRDCFDECGTGVDEQRCSAALHQTDGDIEER